MFSLWSEITNIFVPFQVTIFLGFLKTTNNIFSLGQYNYICQLLFPNKSTIFLSSQNVATEGPL